ncbi:alpha/beta hydrolase [Bacillaceae bacterium S4-13-58]
MPSSTEDTIVYDAIGEGSPIIFIHPPGMGRKVFHFQYPLQSSFQLLIPDLSGHGDSLMKTGVPTIDSYAKEILSILDQEGLQQATILGYSAGGSIAQHLAIHYPERVKGMILFGGFPCVATKTLALQFRIGMKMLESNPEILAKILAKSHTTDRTVQRILFKHMMKANVANWYHFYNQSLHYDCVDELTSIKVPTLLVYGTKIKWIKAHEDFYNGNSHMYKKIIPHATHQIPTKQMYTANRLIDTFQKKYIDASSSSG